MPAFVDLTGRRYGTLVVIARDGVSIPTKWRCRCDCGAELRVLGRNLKGGFSTTCGNRLKHIRQRRSPTIVSDGIVITLTKGYVTSVDTVDSDLATLNWAVFEERGGKRYAFRMIARSTVFLHREIGKRMGLAIEDAEVDHRDGDGLNNRRANLRQATTAQNQHNSKRHRDNTSGVKGVSWNRQNRNWEARIQFNRKRIFLGTFATRDQAAEAYAAAARSLHQDFARADRAE